MATFFFDNDISYHIAHALAQLVRGHEAKALRDVFPDNALDSVWIPEVAKREWIVISRDQNQRRRDSEHQALKAHGARVLYVRYGGKQLTLYADAARLVKNWPKIEAWGLSAKKGTLARLTKADKIENL